MKIGHSPIHILPQEDDELDFISRYTRSQISGILIIHAAPLLVEGRALYIMLHYTWTSILGKEKELHA